MEWTDGIHMLTEDQVINKSQKKGVREVVAESLMSTVFKPEKKKKKEKIQWTQQLIDEQEEMFNNLS